MLLTMPMAVELSICIGMGGCGCPTSCNMSLMTFNSCVFTNKAPNLATAKDAVTSLRVSHVTWMLPLRKMGLLFCGTVPKK